MNLTDKVQNERDAARAELILTRGAMIAQDEREEKAGDRCGVSYMRYGCDWPEAVADELLAARMEIARLRNLAQQIDHDHAPDGSCFDWCLRCKFTATQEQPR